MKSDSTVEVRPVVVGPAVGGEAAITSGVTAAERVVVDGVDKLRAGSAVRLRDAAAQQPAAEGKAAGS